MTATTERETREIIKGFLECPEIADCAPDDKDPDTSDLERRARALLATAEPSVPSGWRDIESAPKDGTRIILAWGVRSVVGYWLDNSGQPVLPWSGWKVPSMEIWPGGKPTHWQPLPAPPSADDSTALGASIRSGPKSADPVPASPAGEGEREKALEETAQLAFDQTSDDPAPGSWSDACEHISSRIRSLQSPPRK